MRAFVSVAPDQVCRFTDPEGKSGLWYLVQVAGHLLNPVGSEFTATFVGRLVTTLIQNTRYFIYVYICFEIICFMFLVILLIKVLQIRKFNGSILISGIIWERTLIFC